MDVDLIKSQTTDFELYVLARYFYRVSDQILTDAEYSELEEKISSLPEAQDFLGRVYDEDPVPILLLERFGLKPEHRALEGERLRLAALFDEDKTLSIEPVTAYRPIYDFCMRYRNLEKDIMASVKQDGVNCKIPYIDHVFRLGLSRGRHAVQCLDYTDGLKQYLPQKINFGGKETLLIGETYVLEDKLPYLREKYGKPFVTPKSTALSGLQVLMDHEDYQFFETRIFYADGVGDTMEEMFNILEENGFLTPAHKLIHWEDVPVNFDEFCAWFKDEYLTYLYEVSKGTPSDGVVLEVDDRMYDGELYDKYSTRQLACKLEYWAHKYYVGTVKKIHVKQQRVYASVRIEIEPMKTEDGANAHFLTGYNLGILIGNGIHKGSVVYYERNSSAINSIIYGERLKHLLAEGVLNGVTETN